MKRLFLITVIAFFIIISKVLGQGFLKADGKRIVNEKGENVLLRGIGLGGWMLQEPYMFQLSDVAGTQTEIKSKIKVLIGQKNCDEFYDLYLNTETSRYLFRILALKILYETPTKYGFYPSRCCFPHCMRPCRRGSQYSVWRRRDMRDV